ncbi:MAG: mannose-6-phosphate isomerase [Bacteroidetes bacterium]|nr:MAG: mannose-6-phosphate isomerase [Bacteroidota bacterium]
MSNTELYPLKFKPILKPTIWGGKKLGDILNKPIGNIETCGESWEISGVEDNISEVEEGALKGKTLTMLIQKYKGALIGDRTYQDFGTKFPLLIKFIDANRDLSIQVHPDDDLAKKRHNSFGKTEMWYVIDAEDGATLISGFKKATNRDEYLDYFNSGRLTDLLNREEVLNDDVFFLPAGRVHTIGQGLLIAEIQQTSDITYRIYDFDRVDKNGNKRELHVDEALDAIDFSYYDDYKTTYDQNQGEVELSVSKYFVCNRILTNTPITKTYNELDSFVILMVLEGSGSLKTNNGSYAYSKGDTYFIPANIEEITINPENASKILEVYLPS